MTRTTEQVRSWCELQNLHFPSWKSEKVVSTNKMGARNVVGGRILGNEETEKNNHNFYPIFHSRPDYQYMLLISSFRSFIHDRKRLLLFPRRSTNSALFCCMLKWGGIGCFQVFFSHAFFQFFTKTVEGRRSV
jgi:hypothetical protein